MTSPDSTQDDHFKPLWRWSFALAMITKSPTPLFWKVVNKPTNLQVGFVIPFVEKSNALWSNAALDPEPPFTLNWVTGYSPGCPMSTVNLRSGALWPGKNLQLQFILNSYLQTPLPTWEFPFRVYIFTDNLSRVTAVPHSKLSQGPHPEVALWYDTLCPRCHKQIHSTELLG